MITKEEMIVELKSEYPILRTGDDENGYVQLSAEEYESTISQWADAQLDKLAKEQAELEAVAKRQALLERLGITEEEARLLLG